MCQRYNDNTKKPKLQDTQLGILIIHTFCQKNQQRVSSPGESPAGVLNLSMEVVHLTLTSCISSIQVKPGAYCITGQ